MCWLQVSSSKADGGGALCQSYLNKLPVRVFRSSELESRYAPAIYEDEADQILYRYDGLYAVRAMWDTQGNETESSPPTNGAKHTFFLTRYPKNPVDGCVEEGMHYNKISIHELWNEIQKRKGVRKPRLFQVPVPFMDLAPIGDKSNLSRRRKENIKLPSEENLKIRGARRKRQKSTSPDHIGSNSDSHKTQPPTNGNVLAGHDGNILAGQDYDSGGEVAPRKVNLSRSIGSEDESDVGSSNRPKRASATAARSYLQAAMQNKYGVGEKERPARKRRPALQHDFQYNGAKRTKNSHVSEDDDNGMSDDDHKSISEQQAGQDEIMKSTAPQSVLVGEPNIEADHGLGEVLVSLPGKKRTKPAATTSTVPAKRAYRRKQVKKPESEEAVETEKEVNDAKAIPAKKKLFDPASMKVGYRVNVQYRDVLYKASIRKVRATEGVYDYQIHYDGNKKTNLRWIQSSMIHNVISENVEVEEVKVLPKRGRKPAKRQKEVVQQSKPQEEKDADQPDEIENQKFATNSEVYVEFRKVLYTSTVRSARLNKKRNCEYLVHYDGFKKTADRWVKENNIHEINDVSTLRFNEQRGEAEEPAVGVKKQLEEETESEIVEPEPTIRTRGRNAGKTSETSDDGTLDMGDNDPGVEFLPGSCVFVARKDALYLGKMLKRKMSGKEMDYLVHFDGSTPNYDTWVPLSSIYELNPRTRRIFDRTADKREDMNDEEEEEEVVVEEPIPDPVVSIEKATSLSPSRRTSRAKKLPAKYEQEDADEILEEMVPYTPARKASRAKKAAPKSKAKTKAVTQKASQKPDMDGIDSGVVFLPGSTIFVEWKNGLYLGKMLKRRGKGDNLEYLVHYDGFRQNQDAWVKVSLVYEINPQTKRAFNKQKKK